MKIDQKALEVAIETFEWTSIVQGESKNTNLRDCMTAAIEAYELIRPEPNPWRGIHEVPFTPNEPVYPHHVELFNGFHVGIGFARISEDGEDSLEFWSETGEPIEPKPTMFRTIDPPSPVDATRAAEEDAA